MDVFALAEACIAATSVEDKLARSSEAAALIAIGDFATETSAWPEPIAQPGRPSRPRLVPPRELPQRGLGSAEGRAALVHAVAHIEFNAIDLAWDAVYRFRDMPADYYADWVAVAADEARHFAMLRDRLRHFGHDYGDFDAHNGLWDMVERTAHSDTVRMALVPRVLEARGLDVTPGMIERLHGCGDTATIAVLEVILAEEVAHVAAGTRWFHYCCARDGLDPVPTFMRYLDEYMRGSLRGPFNVAARKKAGFSDDELAWLATL